MLRHTVALRKINLPAPQKATLVALCDHADDDGVCWPSLKTLAYETGLCKTTVQVAVNALVSRGFVSKKPGGGRKSTTYRVSLDGTQGTSRRSAGYQQAVSRVPAGGTEVDFEVDLEGNIEAGGLPPPNVIIQSLEEGKGEDSQPCSVNRITKGEDMKVHEIIEASFSKAKAPGVKHPSVSYQAQAIWQKAYTQAIGGYMTPLSQKSIAQLKKLVKDLGVSNYKKVIPKVVLNWAIYCEYCRNKIGLKHVPSEPNIGFLLKYRQEAMNFTAGASVLLTEQPEVKKKVLYIKPAFLKE